MTLPQATPSLCALTSDLGRSACAQMPGEAGISSDPNVVGSTKNKFRAKSEKGILRLREVTLGGWAHVQGREATASFAAAA